MEKKILSITLAFLMCFGIFAALTAIDAPLMGKAETETKITKDTTEWSGLMIADSDVEINGDVKVTSSATLMLADGVQLTVNGSVQSYDGTLDRVLTVDTQGTGTGVFTINGKTEQISAYLGNLIVNNGTVNIYGAESRDRIGLYAGGIVKVTGGVLNIFGGQGGYGVRSTALTVTGGKLNIKGGDDDTNPAYGMTDAGITVTDYGIATIIGGYDTRSLYYFFAFDGNDEWLEAKMFASNDGVDYKQIDKNADNWRFLRLVPVNPKASYVDKDGKLQSANVTLVTKDTKEWSGWMYVQNDIEIDVSLNITGDLNIILADDATLTVKGSIMPRNLLTVYAQTAGTGKMIVNGFGYGIFGNATFCGGTVDIIGSFGNSGFYSGTLTVTGTAKVTVTTSEDFLISKGGTGADRCKLIVSGNGEISIKGGNGKDGGVGMTNSSVTVTENGVAVISGGEKEENPNIRGAIFGNGVDTIDASIEATEDGITYTPMKKSKLSDVIFMRNVKSIRLTKKIHTNVPYIDADGVEQIATDPEEIEEISGQSWQGWMVAYGEKLVSGVHLTGNTNIILADGAKLSAFLAINCSPYSLNVYVQSTGNNAGTLSVKGMTSSFTETTLHSDNFYGVKGNINIYGGNVDIEGGNNGDKGYPGVLGNVRVENGNVTIKGGQGFGSGVEGNVTVNGGKVVIKAGEMPMSISWQPELQGGTGIKNAEISVNGGELYVNGSFEGYGVQNSQITVKGGVAVINGGNLRGSPYDRALKEIDATIETSTDGINYELYNGKQPGIFEDSICSIRLTPKSVSGSESKETSPDLGDTRDLTIWVILMALSSMGLFTCLVFGKKRNRG